MGISCSGSVVNDTLFIVDGVMFVGFNIWPCFVVQY